MQKQPPSNQYYPGERLPEPTAFQRQDPLTEIRALSRGIYDLLYMRRITPDQDSILAAHGRNGLTVKALGWLAAEGHMSPYIPDNLRGPVEDVNGREEEILRGKPYGGYVVDWAPNQQEAEEYSSAFYKAFRWGMQRRKATLGQEPFGEDHVIGAKAGEIIRGVFERTPPLPMEELFKAFSEGKKDALSRTDVASAVGWLVAEGTLALDQKYVPKKDDGMKMRRQLTVNLRFGRELPTNGEEGVRQGAEALFSAISGRHAKPKLDELIGGGEGALDDAMSLGFLLQKGKVRLVRDEAVLVAKA
jgi:hypothetical protein